MAPCSMKGNTVKIQLVPWRVPAVKPDRRGAISLESWFLGP
ncbi:MAG: hypothetical protein ACKO1M_00905 [Planctomycetota bacterium]